MCDNDSDTCITNVFTNVAMQENDTKRTRAEKKFVEEERKKNEHTAAIKEYEKEFEKLKVTSTTCDKHLT